MRTKNKYFYQLALIDTNLFQDNIEIDLQVATFKTFKDAEKCVLTNYNDIHEDRFDSVQILEIPFGVHYFKAKRKWTYHWDRILDSYFLVSESRGNF